MNSPAAPHPAQRKVRRTADTIPENTLAAVVGRCYVFEQVLRQGAGWHRRPPTGGSGNKPVGGSLEPGKGCTHPKVGAALPLGSARQEVARSRAHDLQPRPIDDQAAELATLLFDYYTNPFELLSFPEAGYADLCIVKHGPDGLERVWEVKKNVLLHCVDARWAGRSSSVFNKIQIRS